jgi:NADP-dependent 3-hydroxy acid dehydrogenase YdfG
LDPFEAFRLDGRVAMVTGASSGLGARFAQVLHSAGASVALVARRADAIAALASSLERAVAIPADIADPSAVAAAVAAVLHQFERIDILVNNAGISDVIAAEDEPLEQFKRTVDVNLTGAFQLSQVVGRHMLERGAGNIINVASMPSSAPGRYPKPATRPARVGS